MRRGLQLLQTENLTRNDFVGPFPRLTLMNARARSVWVVPKALRDELGIRPGDEVDVTRQDDGLVVRRARPGSRLFRRLADVEFDLVSDLRIERERESARDAER